MNRIYAAVAGVAVTAFMSLSLAGPANAANETAKSELTMTPQSGKLSKTERKAVNWRVGVEIKAPASSPKVQPMQRVKTTFPSDMAWVPNSSTPVCPDSEIGPDSNLSFPPDTIIARCPKAVLGNGTAGLYLAQTNNPNGPTLKDPVLIVFNAGKDSSGNPKIKIYGYSAGTGAGVFMSGVLDKQNVLDVKIPVLTYDSGTGDFNLNIPGSNVAEANRRGVNKSFVQAKCSTGTWKSKAEFTLGSRDTAGNNIGPTELVKAPEVTTKCVGENTAGKFGSVKSKGPGKVKKGKKGTYKVTIKNAGGATIKNVKVKASGKGVKGSASGGSIAKGKSKTVKVKVKFSKKGKIKTKFKVTGKGVNAKTVSKSVKVK